MFGSILDNIPEIIKTYFLPAWILAVISIIIWAVLNNDRLYNAVNEITLNWLDMAFSRIIAIVIVGLLPTLLLLAIGGFILINRGRITGE